MRIHASQWACSTCKILERARRFHFISHESKTIHSHSTAILVNIFFAIVISKNILASEKERERIDRALDIAVSNRCIIREIWVRLCLCAFIIILQAKNAIRIHFIAILTDNDLLTFIFSRCLVRLPRSCLPIN